MRGEADMSAAANFRNLIDCVDLFGFRVPVAVPAELYSDYLHYLEARCRVAEAKPAAADVSEA
jgi:hypothetical protein